MSRRGEIYRFTLSFDHMDLGAVLAELHLVHELVDQKNSAAMVRIEILAQRATGNRLGIKTRPGIANNNQDSSLLVAGHQAFDNLAGIFLGSVNDSVG